MNYEEMFSDYSICSCGAVTLFAKDGRSYSCLLRNRKRFLPGLDLRKLHRLSDCYCCDHCVNHYGLDLCACGSGELFDKCEEGLEVCGEPMQVLLGKTRTVAADAWI